MKSALFRLARFVFGVTAVLLLGAAALAAFDVPAELPMWRMVLGYCLYAAAALVFEKFISDDHKDSKGGAA